MLLDWSHVECGATHSADDKRIGGVSLSADTGWLPMNLRRRLAGLWLRRLPDGAISGRLLWLAADRRVAGHRALWRFARPPRRSWLLWLLLQVLLGLRWLLWFSWRDSLVTVAELGVVVAAETGRGRVGQFAWLLGEALMHGLPSWWLYAHRFYLPERRRQMWDYVFDHELLAFHRCINAGQGDVDADIALLRDKLALAGRAVALGLPAVATLAVIGSREGPELSRWAGRRLFCKPRHGARAAGAFELDLTSGSLRLRMLGGAWLGGADALAALDGMPRDDDWLLQPVLSSHPRWTALTGSDFVVVLRLITWRDAPGEPAWGRWAMLSLPVLHGDGTVFFDLPVVDGVVGQSPPEPEPPARAAARRQLSERASGVAVPDWQAALRLAGGAHDALCPTLRSVAWDIAMTTDGPVLLEGNAYWAIDPVQGLFGGLLPVLEKLATTAKRS